jgi:hypothetical protein
MLRMMNEAWTPPSFGQVLIYRKSEDWIQCHQGWAREEVGAGRQKPLRLKLLLVGVGVMVVSVYALHIKKQAGAIILKVEMIN